MKRIEHIVLAADLAGTAVFAIEGANAAIGAGLDLFGVMVLSLVVALGGGVIRDLLIGARPPSAVSDWRYPAPRSRPGWSRSSFMRGSPRSRRRSSRRSMRPAWRCSRSRAR